ncbi:MAG: oligosaccharide flippase family protein [Phycisphaerales bacterium]
MAKIPILQSLQGDGLRAKALRGSGWTIVGFGAGQFLRLLSNLVLTRLLFPEAFGLMALAQVFMQGLNMLSDIGVGPSIVQNKRGDDPDFLSTAWTMQIIRGSVLFLIMVAISYPVSRVYHEPLLFPILIWIGLMAWIKGFRSIGLATANRKMALGKITMIEFSTQVLGMIVMIVWAWLSPTVWALVGGGVAAAVFNVGLGHRVLGSSANRFHFDRAAASEIFHFGKWVFVATAMTYFGGQGLRLVQGYLVPMDILGMISIAVLLGMMADLLAKRLGSLVLFPAFADIHQNRPELLAHKVKEARTKLFLFSCPVFLTLILFGRDIIYLLYDQRYHEAGVFLVVSATSSAIAAQRTPFSMVLIATGDVAGHAMIKVVTAFARVTAVIVGFSINGVVGMLMADIAAQAVIYPFEAWRLKPKGLWLPAFDLSVFAGYLALGVFSYLHGPFVFHAG